MSALVETDREQAHEKHDGSCEHEADRQRGRDEPGQREAERCEQRIGAADPLCDDEAADGERRDRQQAHQSG